MQTIALCTCGVFSTASSLSAGTSRPSSSQALVPFSSSLFLKPRSTHARATTFAPRSGVRAAHVLDRRVDLLLGEDALLHQQLAQADLHQLEVAERPVACL